MKRYLLDTSGYSAYFAGGKRVRDLLLEADEIYLGPVVTGELLYGFGQGRYSLRNRQVLQEFLSRPRVVPLGIDQETAECYAKIRAALRKQGSPIPTNDMWIAASAMQFGLAVLTSDRHFEQVPQVRVELIDPA